MKSFTIDTENNITVHGSRKAARETGLGAFATEEEFATLIGSDNKRLVEIWNSLPGVKPVAKFANRKSATERIWKTLQSLGEQPVAPVPETPFDEPAPEAAPIELPVAEPQTAEAEAGRPQEDATLLAEIEPVALTTPDAGDAGAQEPQGAPSEGEASETATPATTAPKAKKETKAPTVPKAPKPARSEESTGPREGSKTARVVTMLKREGGATLEEIMAQMGWQKHTVRGFMAGTMKKAGYTVESFKSEAGARSYRINP